MPGFLMIKYHVQIPEKVESIVKFEHGKPKILNSESICDFIETIASIDFTKIRGLSEYLSNYKLVEDEKGETER